MKRIFTLLSLCWLLVGTAFAQVSYDQLSETKYYYMKSGRNDVSGSSWNRGYIVMKSDGTNLTLQGITNAHSSWNVDDYKTPFDERTAGKEAMWGVKKYTINNTTYAIIYNAKNGRCFKSTTTANALAVMTLVDEVGYYKFEAMSGANIKSNSYRIRNVSTENADYKIGLAPAQAVANNKCVAAYSGSDTDGGVPICFIEVPEDNTNGTFDPNIRKIVDLRDVYGNATLAQGLMNNISKYSENAQFTALKESLTTFNSAPTVANATSLQTAYSALVPLNCGNEFSYEIYHYKYGTSSGRGMLAYDNSRTGNNQRPVTVGVSYNVNNNDFTSNGYKNPCDEGINTRWALYKNDNGTYYIYNEGNAARMMTAAAPSLWTEDWTKLSIAANSNQANTFSITSSAETTNAIGISLGFYQTGTKDQGDIRTQGNTTDDGVKLMIRIAGLANEDARKIIDAQTIRDNFPVADYGYVGSLNTDAVVTGDNRTVENAKKIITAQQLTIEAGKNYLIYSGYSTDKYVNADPIADKAGDPQDVNRGLNFSTDASPLKAIVQFEKEDTKYKIKHVNSGMYFGQLTNNTQGALPVSERYAGTYELEQKNGEITKFALKETTNDQYIHISNGNLVGYNIGPNGGADGSSVKIKECTTIDLSLSSAGWSTFCSPVALTIPETENLHIYYVSSIKGDAVYVTEITGTIPAKTPVLVNGTANTTITFAIAEDVDAIEGNKLMGTTMRRNGFNADTSENPDVYGLKVSESTASFVPAYSATLPANKAMLPYENVAASGNALATSAFRLVFDENGTTTGIDNALRQNNERGMLRDLNGRIVAYPVRGQVYIQSNGQKIILK